MFGRKGNKSISYHDYGFGKIIAVAKILPENDFYKEILQVKRIRRKTKDRISC